MTATAEPDVLVCETGPRDGLQNLSRNVPTEAKFAFIDAIAAAGVPEIDTTSFVPPRVVPQFFDAAEVVAHALQTPARAYALVPNLKGGERAIAANVEGISFVMSASRSHNRANVNTTPEEQLAAFGKLRALIDSQPAGVKRPHLIAALATSFGCSIEGRIDPAEVRRYAAALVAAGADELALADTVGYANPAGVRRLVRDVRADIGADVPLRLHLHDTLGMGLANAFAGLEEGVRRFDAAVCGLGGCPFAPGAKGNIVTEDLVFMLHEAGLSTGIDLDALMATRAVLAPHVDAAQLGGRLHEAGIPAVLRRAA